jgi:hypothetical protein
LKNEIAITFVYVISGTKMHLRQRNRHSTSITYMLNYET